MMSHLRCAFTDTGNPFAPLSTASSHCTASVPNLCNFLKSTLIKNILNMAYQALQNVALPLTPPPLRALLPLAVLASGHTDTFCSCLVLLDLLFTAVWSLSFVSLTKHLILQSYIVDVPFLTSCISLDPTVTFLMICLKPAFLFRCLTMNR